MRFSTVIEEISGTPLYLVVLFVVLLILMDVILVRFSKLSDVSWKKVDYIWLGAAALGLIGSSGKVDQFLSGRYAENFQAPALSTYYTRLRQSLVNPAGICATYIKGPDSPPDFDEIVEEQRALCAKSNEIANRMPKDFKEGYPPLADTGFERFGQSVKHEKGFIANINMYADEYDSKQKVYAKYEEGSKPSVGEDVLTVLSPLLIAFALALRITKVTGDIKNARQKELAANPKGTNG